jgi:hypothetical protein
MGHPDGAHTHGSGGGSGLGAAVLVLVGAALVVTIAGPVVAAVAELVHIVLIVAAVLLGLGAAALVAYVALRLRHSRADRVTAVAFPRPVPPRPGESLSATRRPAIGQPAEVHLHFHGVAPEDIAAAIRHVRGQVED